MSPRPNLLPAYLGLSAVVFGARTIASEEVDTAFGMRPGKLRERAGILSLSYAGPDETEATLGAQAAQRVLSDSGIDAKEVDCVLAASESHHAFPSLAAQLHLSIGARERCGAIDVGGACLGFVHALAVAKAFIGTGQARRVLVVNADVHSRILKPGRVAGEFGGLFGDGASAFLVQSGTKSGGRANFALRDFFFGCATQYQRAIEVRVEPDAPLSVVFDGDALSRAATVRLDECVCELERLSGVMVDRVAAFATHQPNPRLVALLAKKVGVPVEKFPMIADAHGNLGSTTCAAALHVALERIRKRADSDSGKPRLQPIFVASLGPGLLFGGGWLEPA